MSTINNFSLKIKDFFNSKTAHDLYIVLIIIVVAFGSFGLGRLSSIEEGSEPVSIEYPENSGLIGANAYRAVSEPSNRLSDASIPPVLPQGDQNFVGSKNSDKYHYPWCPGAARIKEENKVWFANRTEAESAGYVPAANCEGL